MQVDKSDENKPKIFQGLEKHASNIQPIYKWIEKFSNKMKQGYINLTGNFLKKCNYTAINILRLQVMFDNLQIRCTQSGCLSHPIYV
jgi:hypothetical protein